MKLSNEWKTLTRDQRRAWNAWARSNPVLLDDGNLRRVSGHKAMTIVLRNRSVAGDAANPAVVPATVAWLNGALTLDDAGPFTTNAGYVGFRTMQQLATATKWFVWATRPVVGEVADAQRLLRFVKCIALDATEADLLIPSFGNDYLAVHGSWDGPGEDGEWPSDTFIWFRLHQYANGQLGPGVVMKGRILVEL
jgi:hypothetical protein